MRPSTAPVASPATPPLTLSIGRAVELTGISRAQLYKHFGRGEIEVRKNGTASLVVFESLQRFVEAMPKADIRVGVAR